MFAYKLYTVQCIYVWCNEQDVEFKKRRANIYIDALFTSSLLKLLWLENQNFIHKALVVENENENTVDFKSRLDPQQ